MEEECARRSRVLSNRSSLSINKDLLHDALVVDTCDIYYAFMITRSNFGLEVKRRDNIFV